MQIETKYLKPGMVLLEDVLGKSNKPIMEKKTVLTEEHITFIKKFMLQSVVVSPLPKNLHTEEDRQEREMHTHFSYEYEQIVKFYMKQFKKIKNNIPLDHLFEIRKHFIPFFEKAQQQSMTAFIFLLKNRPEKEKGYFKSVAMSILAVSIAKHLKYEKKDWLQIGFAALLADIGFAKLPAYIVEETNEAKPTEHYRQHPVTSYKIVEEIATLTKTAKVAILQHQERMDGTGYPAKIKEKKITPYARIIGVCDYVYQINGSELSQIIHLLEAKKGVELDKQIVDLLIGELIKEA